MNNIELYIDGGWHNVMYTVTGKDVAPTFDHEGQLAELEVLHVYSCDENGIEYEVAGGSLKCVLPKIQVKLETMLRAGEL